MLSLLVMLTRELGGVMFLYQFMFFWLLLVIWLILALATMVLLIFGPFLRRNFFKEKLGHLLLRSLLVLGLVNIILAMLV